MSATWKKKLALGSVLVALAGGGYVGLNWSKIQAGRAAGQLRSATTDEARTAAATKLVALGDAGFPALLDVLRGDDAAGCAATVAALRDSWKDTPPTDPAFAAKCEPLLAEAGTFSEAGNGAILSLAADATASPDVGLAAKGRDAIRACLAAGNSELAARAATVAAIPAVGLKGEVVPLLSHADAVVRRAAMRAVGPAVGERQVIGDEELFRWLNDADLEVQALCESALATRGLDGDQIAAAKRLTHPDPTERLKLLLDLRWGRDTVTDPGPWLERLSRDAEPAVRAGAARVAVELRVGFAVWLDRLAIADPDPTVRTVAEFYRDAAEEVKRAGFSER